MAPTFSKVDTGTDGRMDKLTDKTVL